ncbi:MAG: hypothetical protein PF542_01300 [Nanoarchaeota archaeon]|jgi:hypothetical protein|nr:hypothetical protein [Nanoarchaeota archaeon]
MENKGNSNNLDYKTYKAIDSKGDWVDVYRHFDSSPFESIFSFNPNYNESIRIVKTNLDTVVISGMTHSESWKVTPINGLIKIIGEDKNIQETKNFIEKLKDWNLYELKEGDKK